MDARSNSQAAVSADNCRVQRMWELKLIGLLMTIVYWAFSLILVYSVTMSIFRYAFGVQLPNPFAIFQGR